MYIFECKGNVYWVVKCLILDLVNILDYSFIKISFIGYFIRKGKNDWKLINISL